MKEQDKEAFEKWSKEYVEGMEFDVVDIDPEASWQAALGYREKEIERIKNIMRSEAMLNTSLNRQLNEERERSKKLVVHLEILIEVLADDCRSDEDCDHCWAVLALKEYRGEK